jgi:YD repeat-containing protein
LGSGHWTDRAFAPVKIDDAIWGETRFAHPGGLVKIARGPKGERIRLMHDACGRLIGRSVDRDGFRPQRWTYVWDAHDRLVSSSFLNAGSESETWTFTYDPFGRRVTKVRKLQAQERERAGLLWPQPEGRTDTPQVGTFFLWDGDQLIAEAPLRLGGHVEKPGISCDPLGLSPAPSYVRPAPAASANWNTARGNYWKDAGAAENTNPHACLIMIEGGKSFQL